MSRIINSQPVLTAKAATGTGNIIMVEDYKHIVLQFATASSGSMTIKIQGSAGKSITSDDAPDFSAAASKTNAWVYVNGVNYLDNSAVAGGTGVVYTGTDGVNMVEVNTNGLRYITVTVTAWAAGNVDVKALLLTNE